MWFKHRAWIPVFRILSVLNVGAIWFAASPGEAWHATGHGLLAVLFGVGAQYLAARRTPMLDAEVGGRIQELEAQLADLDRLPASSGRLTQLEERLDFMERALVEVRNKAQIPGKQKPPSP